MIPPWTERYVGLPFVIGGRGPGAYDCWGLTRLVLAEQFAVPFPSFDGYDAEYDHAALANHCAAVWPPCVTVVGPVHAQPGDVVLLRMAGQACHVGLIVAPPYFLHTEPETESCLERLDSARWQRRIAGIYRPIDLAS